MNAVCWSDHARSTAMPFAQIYLLEGRTEEQKRAVIEKVTAALVEALGAPQQNVRVWIHDMPKENWGIGGQTAKDLGR
ncbi:2-hydroxymuconate tautomerase [Vitreoscilla filiformis]|nr:2-hydroxymuconate tautomerase [Vitreoscilla filiformis]